jgi:hypothetical protein
MNVMYLKVTAENHFSFILKHVVRIFLYFVLWPTNAQYQNTNKKLKIESKK